VRARVVVAIAIAGCGRIDFESSARPDCTVAGPGEPCMSLMLGDVSWQDAVTACEQLDPPAHLATITNTDDNLAAAALAARIPFESEDTNQRQRMWIGGNSLAAVGIWKWITEEPFGYTNWRVGQPGSPTTERCLVLLGSQGGLWDDRPCAYEYEAYLCERDE